MINTGIRLATSSFRVLRIVSRRVHGRRIFHAVFGGEEFAVILPDTDVVAAEEVAERYCSSFESIVWAEHESVRLTASFGVASVEGLPDPDPRTLIEAADQALYRAKQEGRNLVRVAEATKTHAASPLNEPGAGVPRRSKSA